MLGALQRIKRLIKPEPSPFVISSIQASDIADSHISYDDLFTRKYDALIIRGFYSVDELKNITTGLEKINDSSFTQYDGRYKAIPPVFEKLRDENAADYFVRSRKEFELLSQTTGVDFEQKNYSLFKLLAKGNQLVGSPRLQPEFQPFASGCMRIIPPSYGIIRVHADNDFYSHREEVFEYFRKEVDTSNHVSYIATIRKAKAGGNLVLHHADYKVYDTINNNMELVHKETGHKKHIDFFGTTELEVNEGDLVLFSGGQIWHSVNKMKGDGDRITYGGFSAYSTDRKKIYLWT
ncbi:MAG TPA: hypothetical protein PLW44_01710 [Chitinophagales bacterium]|nr:hypothetical protein [Chitinophagales bacterium]